MGKVISMKKWVEDHRWEDPYPEDLHNYGVNEDLVIMLDYVDESILELYDRLVELLVDEDILPKEYKIDNDE